MSILFSTLFASGGGSGAVHSVEHGTVLIQTGSGTLLNIPIGAEQIGVVSYITSELGSQNVSVNFASRRVTLGELLSISSQVSLSSGFKVCNSSSVAGSESSTGYLSGNLGEDINIVAYATTTARITVSYIIQEKTS